MATEKPQLVATIQHDDQGEWPGDHKFDGGKCWCEYRILWRREKTRRAA